MTIKQEIVRQFGNPRGLFGRLAGQTMANRSSNKLRNRATVDLLDLQSESRVLEIGCGPGLALTHCANVVLDGRLVGVDHSKLILAQAARRLSKSNLLSRTELISDPEVWKTWNAGFDRVFSINVIQFIGDKPDFFSSVFKCLAPSGRCATTYQPRMDNESSSAAEDMALEVKSLLWDAGFSDIAQTSIAAGNRPAVCIFGSRSP